MIRTNTSAYPHHMNVVCVWHCCGSHLEGVFSLNYGIMLWVATTGVTRILSNNQKLGKRELQKHHNDKHIWTSTPYESCETPCMCLILISGSHLEWIFNLNNGRGCTGEFFHAKAKKGFGSTYARKIEAKKCHEAQFVPPPKLAISLSTMVANIHLGSLFHDVNIMSSRL